MKDQLTASLLGLAIVGTVIVAGSQPIFSYDRHLRHQLQHEYRAAQQSNAARELGRARRLQYGGI